ncbi:MULTISPECIES: hypothetical protein [unclassified Xanthobacter]|uniref:hypothetical protein n=1 Tax=unclassified Xanthobacter TaxID=2623496 RepID=UPI001EDE5A35|nr:MULTISPECIES: hypothetical protein [unclassified Xanthobacter]
MSTTQANGFHPETESELKRQAQSQQWRAIGISAVAAAAEQAAKKTEAELQAAAKTNRIVTLRDIDYFAA